MNARPLGRLEPTDWRHVERFPFAAPTPATVEHTLRLPGWRLSHDQGREGSCVGHAVAMERAITNLAEDRASGKTRQRERYDPIVLWRTAKGIDEYSFTKPDDDKGTSVRAAYEVTRTIGLVRVRSMHVVNGRPVPVYYAGASEPTAQLAYGVEEYRWARTVDEIRAAIAAGVPVAIGIDWHAGFDDPLHKGRERWLPEMGSAGRVRGGHSVALYGASDRRQAFKLVNSWGRDYPLVWMPYDVMSALLDHAGEAALVTDRIQSVG